MAYQIKSTPFFRRMVSTSKKNGQLQKLKEEYERMKDFNDRSIEMKMRQVRLKRLFREIEEIKESSSSPLWKRRRMVPEKPKTAEEKRLETLQKAKELGKEYSKMNAIMQDRHSYMGFSNSHKSQVDGERRARSYKRMIYGNEISKCNRLNMMAATKKGQLKREHNITDASSTNTINKEKKKLQQRIEYGNNRSDINMAKIPKLNVKHKIATDKTEYGAPMHGVIKSNVGDMYSQVDDVQYNSLVPKETRIFKTYSDLQNSDLLVVATDQSQDESVSRRARQYWHKLALVVGNPFVYMRRKLQRTVEGHEYQLRTISNETNLPQSELCIHKDQMLSDGNDGTSNEEVLVHVELFDSDCSTIIPTVVSCSSRASEESLMSLPLPAPSEEEADCVVESSVTNAASSLPPHGETVKNYVKMFEPHASEDAEKEFVELGVQQLRCIFEHQIDSK